MKYVDKRNSINYNDVQYIERLSQINRTCQWWKRPFSIGIKIILSEKRFLWIVSQFSLLVTETRSFLNVFSGAPLPKPPAHFSRKLTNVTPIWGTLLFKVRPHPPSSRGGGSASLSTQPPKNGSIFLSKMVLSNQLFGTTSTPSLPHPPPLKSSLPCGALHERKKEGSKFCW